MKRLICALYFLFLALVGCGGSSNGANASVYVGTYAGTYNEPTLPQSGTVNFTVDQNGNIAGTTTNSANQAQSTITGAVDNNNNIQGSIVTGSVTVTFAGTFTAGAPVNNVIPYTASLTVISGSTSYADTWTLTQTQTGPAKRR